MTLGALSVELDREEELEAVLRGLMRQLDNQEVAGLLGVTERTVRRWKRSGRLPSREGGRLMLVDLLHFLRPQAPVGAADHGARPGRSRAAE